MRMAVAAQIRELRDYAEAVLRALEAEPELTESEQADPRLLENLAQVRELADETIRRAGSPVKIGITGEFSAGKTLLLGSLVGYADALPVHELPSTGNVTALRLVHDPEARGTQIGPFSIEFMDQPTARACLRELLRTILADPGMAKVPPDLVAAASRLLERADELPWADVLTWCKQVESAAKPDALTGLRPVLRELGAFARAGGSSAGSALLAERDPAKRTFEVDQATAAAAMRLPRGDERAALLDPPGALEVPLSAAFLQRALPLVRRVEVRVCLPDEVWNLSSIRGAGEFVLLDFPGLGAKDSGIRDTFLCNLELKDVQTIVMVEDGRSPGGNSGKELFDLMQRAQPGRDLRDSILVAVNRFDQLPIQSDPKGGEHDLAEMLDSANHSAIREQKVLEAMPLVATTVKSAVDLAGREDRVVLTSAVVALGSMAETYPEVAVGSAPFRANLPTLLLTHRALRDKWGRLADALRQADPRSRLGRWLADYAADGGMPRLRKLLLDHVSTHGLQQLLDHVRAAAESLRAVLARLPRHRAEPTPTGKVSADDLRRAVGGLREVYIALKTEFGQSAPELTVIPDEDEEVATGARPPLGSDPIPIHEHIHDTVTRNVWDWAVWNRLLLSILRGGPTQAQRRGPRNAMDEDEGDASDDGLPATSRDFRDWFLEAVTEGERFARDCLKRAVPRLLSDVGARTRHHLDRLRPLLDDAAIEDRLREFDTNRPPSPGRRTGTALLRILHRAADPGGTNLRDRTLESVFDPERGIALNARFPLPGAEDHQAPQVFPWADGKAGDPRTHQILVWRLRDALAQGTRQPVLQLASELSEVAFEVVEENITTAIDRLDELSNHAALLACLAGEDTQPADRRGWKAAAIPFPALSGT
jgi:hypothetical protein